MFDFFAIARLPIFVFSPTVKPLPKVASLASFFMAISPTSRSPLIKAFSQTLGNYSNSELKMARATLSVSLEIFHLFEDAWSFLRR